jgi:acetylornithine deacetylase
MNEPAKNIDHASTSSQQLKAEAVQLLKELVSVPSFSKEEHETAGVLCKFFGNRDIAHYRVGNNVYAFNKYYDDTKPSILLNSHHDTVKPNSAYTLDPFNPIEKDGKIFGLGSNDAGGSLVSLIAVFLYYYDKPSLNYNLVLAASAEEEISGSNGIEMILPHLGKIDCAIVGEPTQMQMAVAEKGLLVLDCKVNGKAGHAARDEGDNAIYKALPFIDWFRHYSFSRISPLLGPVKMSVTSIETTNKAHNVVPAECRFTVDIRVNELYTFEEILDTIRGAVVADINPRSLRMRSSSIGLDHPLVLAGKKMGRSYYGSPTTSDKALMPFPALKMGPGDSARSHTANEFIYKAEIEEGVDIYLRLLEQLL